MNNKVIVGVIVAILIIGAGFFMLRPQSDTETMASPSPAAMQPKISSAPKMTPMATSSAQATSSAKPGAAMGKVVELVVDGTNFKFEPATLSVNKGDTVRVVFKNTQGFHDFVIDELNVRSKQAQSPAEETLEFVADKAGSFEYYCSVGKHRQMGMKGTLTVK